MERTYYKAYYDLERTHWWFTVREKILMDQLRRLKKGDAPLKILNIGSATGRSSQALMEFGDVLSVEYDKECFLFCRDELNLSAIQASITELPFDDAAYDIVCAFDVIEHVEDDKRAIGEMIRVCKSGGFVFLSVPAFQVLWSVHDEVNHHFRRYTLPQIQKLFDESSGVLLRNSYFNSLLFLPIYFFRLLQKMGGKSKSNVNQRSDFEQVNSPILNKLFGWIFSMERNYLHYFTFPAGVSLFYLWKKN